jgi:tRNA U34 5-carboxymethylaminomethyl modifying enzyme MnmG/GidA
MIFRASEMLSFANDNITVPMLAWSFPDIFGKLVENEELCRRLKIEALYQNAVIQQYDQVSQIRKDQTMLIPPSVDYTS